MIKLKKFIYINIITFLLGILIINTNVYAWCDAVSASKQVKAVRVTLSNGTVLHNLILEKSVANATTTTNFLDLHVWFIVDTSSSMQSKLESVKGSMRTFMSNMYTFYGNRSNQIQMGVVGFDETTSENPGEANIQNGNIDQMYQEINKLAINGSNRDIAQATEMALDKMRVSGPNDNLKQIAIFFSDGDIENLTPEILSEANMNFTMMENQKMTILFANAVETGIDNETFQALFNGARQVEWTQINQTYSFWVSSIEDFLKNSLVDFSTIMPTVTSTTANSFTTVGNDVILYMDNELLHGALLEVEYLMTGNRAFTATDTISSEVTFSRDTRLLTEPHKTNADYGWISNDGGRTVVSSGRSSYKLILTTVLTETTVPDMGFKNVFSANFSNIVTLNNVSSGYVRILPPFGNNENTTSQNIYLIIFTTSASVLIFISILIITIKMKIKKKKGNINE